MIIDYLSLLICHLSIIKGGKKRFRTSAWVALHRGGKLICRVTQGEKSLTIAFDSDQRRRRQWWLFGPKPLKDLNHFKLWLLHEALLWLYVCVQSLAWNSNGCRDTTTPTWEARIHNQDEYDNGLRRRPHGGRRGRKPIDFEKTNPKLGTTLIDTNLLRSA